MIRGIAWDHNRCWGPLDASVEPYRAASGQQVQWDRRSLYSFGEGHISDFCADYDLIIYDHPFVGEVARDGLMRDLMQWLTPADIARFADDAVGQSWKSYAFAGGVWGLPIDAAAQTAAWRTDLLDRHDAEVPVTLDAVHALADRLRPLGLHIGWPAVPTDQMCTFLTIAASLGMAPATPGGPLVEPDAGAEIVGQLRRLLAAAHPGSIGWNPIRCLDHMAAADDVAYVPWLFNYVNYATPGAPRPIRFGAAPRVAAERPARTLLGGAGIGISSAARDPAAAFAYARYLCDTAFQTGDYVRHGGQPGNRAAWTSEVCNDWTGGFLRDTLPVLDQAWLRPIWPGFVGLFRDATQRLAAVLDTGAGGAEFLGWLNGEHARLSAASATASAALAP